MVTRTGWGIMKARQSTECIYGRTKARWTLRLLSRFFLIDGDVAPPSNFGARRWHKRRSLRETVQVFLQDLRMTVRLVATLPMNEIASLMDVVSLLVKKSWFDAVKVKHGQCPWCLMIDWYCSIREKTHLVRLIESWCCFTVFIWNPGLLTCIPWRYIYARVYIFFSDLNKSLGSGKDNGIEIMLRCVFLC